MSRGPVVAGLTSREELYELLDPDVLWYSVDLDSSSTCSCDDVIETIERGMANDRSGTFEVLAERDDYVVVRAVTDVPGPERDRALLLRFRDGLIAEIRKLRLAGCGASLCRGRLMPEGLEE
jgi:hypothetical protein